MTTLTHGARRAAERARRRGGFTLVEMMVGMMFLAVAVCGTLASTVSSSILGRVNHETTLAYEAARQRMEVIRSTPFGEVFAAFNEAASDDGTVTGNVFGAGFDVRGLGLAKGDTDGMVGLVVFSSATDQLFENVVDDKLGMPRDLNADGLVDAGDHAGDYEILPVTVRVEWTGVSGRRVIELHTILSGR